MNINKNKNKQRKAKTPCTSVLNTDESTYECEVCLIMDDEGKVRCDECHRWYHFDCANTSIEALKSMEHWACIACDSKNEKQSTPNKPNEEQVPNPPTSAIVSEGNTQPKAVGQSTAGRPANIQTDSSNPGTANPLVSDTRNEDPILADASNKSIESLIGKPPSHGGTKSRKSKSSSSTISRRTALALQRLEEEKKLREQRELEQQIRQEAREREYLDKKYSILEDQTDGEISLTDEEQERVKRHRTQQWTEKLPNASDNIVIGFSELDLIGTNPILKPTATDDQPNQPVGASTSAKNSRRGSENSCRSNQRSNASIKKAKVNGSSLPNWLTAPLKMVPDLFPFKSSSAHLATMMGTTTAASAGSFVSSVNKQFTRYSFGTESQNGPALVSTSVTLLSSIGQPNVPVAQNANSNRQAFTSSIPFGTSNVYQGNPPVIQSSSMASTSNQTFYFGLRPTTADNNTLSNVGRPSNVMSTASQSKDSISSCNQGISINHKPITTSRVVSNIQSSNSNATPFHSTKINSKPDPSGRANVECQPNNGVGQSFGSGLFGQVNHHGSQAFNPNGGVGQSVGSGLFGQVNHHGSQAFNPNGGVGQSVGSGLFGQVNHHGSQAFNPNGGVGQSVGSGLFGQVNHHGSQAFNPNGGVGQSVGSGLFEQVNHHGSQSFNPNSGVGQGGVSQGVGSVSFGQTNHHSQSFNPNTSVSQNVGAVSFGQTNHGSQPFVPNSNVSQNVGSGTYGYANHRSQSFIPNGNVSQNVGFGSFQQFHPGSHTTSPNGHSNQNVGSGMNPVALNISTSSTHRARLTAEQIASRHVIPKLPYFDGDPKHWQVFISAYEYSTDECGFTNVENLGRLQASLKGDARNLVESRLLHPNSVPAAINTLKLVYGRPELIIDTMIEKIKKEPSPRDDDLATLIKFAIAVQNLCGSIQETGALEHLRNPTLMNVITDKLPTQVQLNWAYYKHSIGVVDLSTLGDWLYGLADVASQVVRKSTTKPVRKKENEKSNDSDGKSNRNNYLNTQVENKSKSQGQVSTNQQKSNKCLACKSESCSKVSTCKQFKNWSRSERWKFVKDNKLCSRCLGAHSFYRCRSELSCKADKCTKKHHTMLHDNGQSAESSKNEKKPSPSENKSTDPEDKTPTSVCNSQQSKNNRTDIFRIVPVVLRNKTQVVRDFAYLDEGSNLTLMEDGLADELELVGTPEAVCIDWAFGQSHESEESRIVATKISGFYHQAPSYKLENVRTVKDLHLPTQALTSACLERYPHLKNVPIVTYEAVKPRMLIGLQYSKLTVSLETIEGAWDEPLACRTRLGWVLQGPSYDTDRQTQKKFSLNLCQCQTKDNRLHQLVKEYFSIENFGVKLSDKFLESKQVQRARQILETTTVKRDGRYESGLLWKYDQFDLPDSYNMAFKRLQCLESKMAKNPQLAENLCDQIKQFVIKGYVRKLSPSELAVKKEREWYLPIFPVFNPKKPTKVRIVWDAAAKVKNISLNSMLLTGPDLLVPLVDILRRFRERSIAVLGDIREMYHQIQIIEQDQDVQRFLWRDGNSSKKPDVYVMLVSTFGAACSPCTAQFVKNKNANEFKNNFPEAAEAIINSTYVDDLLDSVHKFEDAVKLVEDVKYVNQQAGFETRNFLSNSKELLEKIGERSAQHSKNLNINTDVTLGTERVLGMFWNADMDNFTYSLKYSRINQDILSGERCPTKREVLRLLMSIFDPLGLLANFLVYAKILLQEIWRNKIEWDEQITEPLLTKWMKWTTALKGVEDIQIARLYSLKLSPDAPKSIQLHVFVDASVEAFAAAAFLRIEDDDGIDCCLVGAKTKVAPNKLMSVPRLELQAAVLGARLSGNIKTSQRLEFEKVIYWSDSKTVMAWINSETRRYHQFVAFRIGEILESTELTEWRWVPSEHNVADEATKSKIQKLDSTSRWYKGPKFLYDDEMTWFIEENRNEHHTEEEMRPSIVMACRQGRNISIVDVKRFSQWNRLVHTTAYVFRFIHNLKTTKRRTGPLQQDEIVRGENQLYRTAQQDHYLDEIAILERNANLPPDEQRQLEKSSELYKSSPYLDDHGVLRIRGRTGAAKCLTQEAKRPIIMPRRHHITKLIVNHYHRRFLHLNHQSVLNEVKQKFDIPALRVVLNEVRNACQKCKNDSAAPQIPEMAELPYARLAAYERPYTYVGIDYFGPFKVKITRNCSAKRWGVLYTCLTTRAIHLEVAHSLNTSSCIMAFERFGNDCGFPREVYSDNGSNFHGMENELKEEFKKLDQDEMQKTFTSSEMKWSFNPPLSPHMGGAWERLISTVKSCFKKIVTTRNPTDETLPTLFAQVENIVNSRPLTYVSLDSADSEALTPNHFLFGSSNGRKPICNSSPTDLNRNDWKNVQEQTNQFWKRFVLEYMPTLTKRTKWFKQSKPVEVGDVVMIIDETNPRNTWPKGIVEQTFIGKGGKRRQAMVRVVVESKIGPVHKEYKRSVHKLAILDVKVPANEEVNRQPVESINGGETVGQH